MVESLYRPYQPDFVSSPGDTLQETIEALGLSPAALAERTGMTVEAINEFLQGRSAITPETALQLERVLSVPAGFWLKREARFREPGTRLAGLRKGA
jgi:addiction module HigA family antidote